MGKNSLSSTARPHIEVSIIVPVHNEEESIGSLLNGLVKIVDDSYEVIVVDDHSTDGSGWVVNRFMGKIENMKLISNIERAGFADTLRLGFQEAEGEIVIPVMADGCDDINLIPALCKRIRDGFDIVGASRYIRGGRRVGGPLVKHIFSRFFCLLVHKLGRIPLRDISNAFKAYRRCLLKEITLDSRGFDISVEIVMKAFYKGYRVTEIPTIWYGRNKGKSKFSFLRHGLEYTRWLLLAAFSRGI